MHRDVRSLQAYYGEGKSRHLSYRQMVDAMLDEVRAGKRVCGAFYGTPGVFALAPHQAIAQAREEGFDAVMEPGISAEDCLYADLGIDPASFRLSALRGQPVDVLPAASGSVGLPGTVAGGPGRGSQPPTLCHRTGLSATAGRPARQRLSAGSSSRHLRGGDPGDFAAAHRTPGAQGFGTHCAAHAIDPDRSPNASRCATIRGCMEQLDALDRMSGVARGHPHHEENPA